MRKLFSIVFLTLLLTSVFNIQRAKAETGTIYIRADGSVDPPTAPIQRVGNTYVFTSDIRDSIVVERDNIVIDGAGYTLQGTGSGTGVNLTRRTNVTIRNIQIKNFDYGIYLYSSSNNNISGNNITENNYDGIRFGSSSNNIISGNNIANNWLIGIGFSSSSNNIISGNNIENNEYGYLYSSSSNVIRGNTFINDGLFVWFSYRNIVENNTVNGKPLVYLENVRNYFVGDAGQVILVNCSNIMVENLNISRTNVGVQLWGTSNSIISGNNIENNKIGVSLVLSSSNTVSRNNIANNTYGIYLYSSNNKFYHNNLIDNSQQVYSYRSTNVWDDGYPSGGNYWDDYTGVDADGDGIGDTPYVIDENNKDRYPLMKPYNILRDVKFRGTVVNFSPDYVDWIITIEEIIQDPTDKLNIGEETLVAVHNETHAGKPWIIGEPVIGDYVEVYGEYIEYAIWVHKSYHYVKKIALTAHIEIPSQVPFNRFFDINVEVKNLKNTPITLRLALQERTGFQAGVNYGDGDEEKSISLAPNEEKTLTFKAKVYGVPRVKDVARFKIYDEEGKLLEQKECKIDLNSEFANITAVIAPSAIRKGTSFSVGLPVFYSFSLDTYVELVLKSKETGKTLQNQEMLNGEGLKFYTFRVDRNLVDLDSEGVRNFEVEIRVYYPEENNRRAYEKKFDIAVRVSNDVGTGSVVLDSNFRVILTYRGKQYIALYAYNATYAPPPQTGDFRDIIEWASSQRNWLVFEAVDGTMKPPMDDELYKTLAFAAEVAHLRATCWNSEFLASRSEFFSNLKDLAIKAEICDFIAKLAGKLAGIIGLKKASAWASSVMSGVEAGGKVSDIALTIARAIEILQKIDLRGKVLEAVNRGLQGEKILVWTAIFMIEGGTTNLDEANKLLTGISLLQTVMNVDADEALRFYNLVQAGETQGLGGMRFLSTYYSKDTIDVMGFKVNIRAFKDAFKEAIPVIGDVYEFYENLKNGFSIPEAFEFGQYLSTTWEEYEIRKEIFGSTSLKFRDKYISESANSLAITLSEPKTQQKLHLSVYDSEGRLVGFNRASGIIEVNIGGCYYLDFDNVIKITLPREIKIDRILVDATDAEAPVENYNLTVEVYEDGNLAGSVSKSEQIKKMASREYTLQLTEDSKPILNEISAIHTPTPMPTPTPTPVPDGLVGWILVAAIAVAAAIILLSLYLRAQALPGYYLLDKQGRVVFSGRGRDHVYGREDFVGLLPPQLLEYITRRSKGGQFRIFIHDNTYYIEDNYSRNPTLVDGASIRGKGPIPLRDGCSISISGVFHLVFRRARGQ